MLKKNSLFVWIISPISVPILMFLFVKREDNQNKQKETKTNCKDKKLCFYCFLNLDMQTLQTMQ